MAFEKIAGKVGIYRHLGTGFVVHEVYNTQQLLDANGVFCEYSNGYWAWMAGRDMRDMFQVEGIASLNDVVSVLGRDNQRLGTMCVTNSKANNAAAHAMFVTASAIITTSAGFPGTFTDTPYSSAKIFALINNCHAGFGSGGGSYRTLKNDSWTPYDFAAAIYQGVLPATDIQALYRNGPIGYCSTYERSSDNAQLLGTAVIAVPLGMTWDAFADDLVAHLPDGDRDEVKAKCAQTMIPMLPKLKAITPIPYTYVPVEILTGGRLRLVAPKAASVVKRTISSIVTKQTVHTMRGGVSFNHRGVARTASEWIVPGMTYAGAVDLCTSFTHRQVDYHDMDENYGGFNTGISYPVYNEALLFSEQIDAIDGVRLERILGGLANHRLGNTGEADMIAASVNFTSAALVAKWVGAMRFGTSSNTLVRGADAQGVPETDAAYENRIHVAAAVQGVEDPLATRLTQWDNHGFTAGHGMMALLASLDGETTDASWMTCLWPARQRIIPPFTPKQGGSYPAIAAGVMPVATLIG